MRQTLYAVVRPDGTVIECEPGSCREFSLWNALEHDERLRRIVKRNSTGNVSNARRVGYDFMEITDG